MLFDFIKNRKFRKAVENAVADQVLTDQEVAKLEQLQRKLGLSGAQVQKEYDRLVMPVARRMLERKFARIRATRRCPPSTIRDIERIGEQLKIAIDLDYSSLRAYQDLWKMEKDPDFRPEPIQADIRLGRNEECYHHCAAEWAQLTTTRTLHGFVGGSLGFRVAKGVTLRLGGAVPVATTSEDLRTISDGELFVTNKKMVFLGTRRSTTITFGRLARWNLYKDALEVEKNTGKPDVFSLEPVDVEYIDALLQMF